MKRIRKQCVPNAIRLQAERYQDLPAIQKTTAAPALRSVAAAAPVAAPPTAEAAASK